MQSHTKKTVIVIVAAAIVALALLWAEHLRGIGLSPAENLSSMSVGTTTLNGSNSYRWSLSGSDIYLLEASTTAEQEQGLSDVPSLASDTGMLFVFPSPGPYGFWMKDMDFSLDMVWLDQDFEIVHIESGLSPGTYPNVYYPGSPAQYVVEVASGTAQKFGLQAGQTMEIRKE
jgi:hypothetical protein